ncbi:UvrD-helicase domain-containing protein [Thermophagus sp. OGC60D27]|uniref:UvrD-helicase domain-containing protein n=1 Tax=Thermophagus sp. OGC60D27 TaxID=3458415 RepID=UPI0040377A42
MSQLKIYRASAGSGKTFTLTREFIRLLFADPFEYRHILAVTFTNKATAEMRQRILKKIYELGYKTTGQTDYLDDLMAETGMQENQVRKRARLLLRFLLHDFSKFSVNTIDSFFQQVIRAFARDAGLQMGFRTELDHQSVLTQAIDRVVLEIDMKGHEAMKRWMINFADKKISEGKSWNINREISTFSEEIFKETYQSAAESLSRKLADKNFMNSYLSKLRQIITNYENLLQQFGEKGLQLIRQFNLDISNDFNNGSRSKMLIFKKMAEKYDFKEDHILALHNNLSSWKRKKNPPHIDHAIDNLYQGGLNDMLGEIVNFIHSNKKNYLTAKAILKNFYALGIINDVNQKIQEISREQNVFLLAGTNHLLSRIIKEDEAPFIYERTGNRYSHYMIDEFQDTSALQYANFRPLIINSLAQDKFAMLVGDIKQSIYRWRNSDWTLLADQVEEDFKIFGAEVKSLDTNWRSSDNIIAFNNSFFTNAAKALQANIIQRASNGENQEMLPDEFNLRIMEAYKDVVQKKPAKDSTNEGHVSFSFLEADKKEEFQIKTIQATVEHINNLLMNGFSFSDICILVRKKSEGTAITKALLSGEYHPENKTLPVISNETLQLSSSSAVLFVINHLKFIQNPDDKVLEAFIRLHWERYHRENNPTHIDASGIFHNPTRLQTWEEHLTFLSNKQPFPLYDLADELVRLLPREIREDQGIYIQTLLNRINQFSSRETADLNLFLDEWEKIIRNESVMLPENQEAIQVMTIHKSKGLEFEAVIMPFCNWDLDASRQQNLLWCHPPKPPFNELELIPVNYEKSLIDSHFQKEYLQELMDQYIDNLNLLYVAFTRAKQSLTAFCQYSKKGPTDLVNVSDLLWFHFLLNHKDIPGKWDEENYIYSFGSPTPKEEENLEKEKKESPRSSESFQLNALETYSFRDRIHIHKESNEFFDNESMEHGVSYGKIMHHLFEMIETRDDLNEALKNLWYEGKIEEKEIGFIRSKMNQWLQHPEVQKWFDGSSKVLSEIAIIDKDIRRPDRVMISADATIVVDYKFGKVDEWKHHAQVRGYMNSIKKMGHPNVKGYIWYVPHGEVVKVDNMSVQGKLF